MPKIRYAHTGKFPDPRTPREFLINCSFDLETDAAISWPDRLKGFIALDHILEYVSSPDAYENKHREAAFFGAHPVSELARSRESRRSRNLK